MARRKNKFVETADELNLVPIMNLVLCLIPVVLFGTQLVKIGITNISAPKLGQSKPNPNQDEEKPLGLTVAIAKDGFRLKATGVENLEVTLGLKPAGSPPPPNGLHIPMQKQRRSVRDANGNDSMRDDFTGYNFPQLYLYMEALRDKYPKEKLLSLTADPDMPFKYLIRTMDTVRYRLASELRDQTGDRGAYLLGITNGIQSLEPMAKSIEFSIDKTETTVTENGEDRQVVQLTELWNQVTFTVVR